ncbi:hypothetical protein Curi_c24770 [Gottschalkia acidurici 9a]|uniref:Uncharacterized protein n=1 Tax=Gottschalkia acidurici (strain ATCC 7906 / DSM 604 / BCRC 14475 / CIP 104303 / KCTC 5404 / NCIMB 10678 / 9a) TaxID=1128398 RepID=K0B2V0_GOTA9|nr:hypothetical protein [Gottschalkia acidurici]AFS79472.1 hypothetical protein Curi_c24770 [Gottschalkia acidurici 9a]
MERRLSLLLGILGSLFLVLVSTSSYIRPVYRLRGIVGYFNRILFNLILIIGIIFIIYFSIILIIDAIKVIHKRS